MDVNCNELVVRWDAFPLGGVKGDSVVAFGNGASHLPLLTFQYQNVHNTHNNRRDTRTVVEYV
jgi:hypothetical protein